MVTMVPMAWPRLYKFPENVSVSNMHQLVSRTVRSDEFNGKPRPEAYSDSESSGSPTSGAVVVEIGM